MDSDLYDEFGNYIGPDVDEFDSDEEEAAEEDGEPMRSGDEEEEEDDEVNILI